MDLQIENFSVRNYRCISNIQLDNLSPITIFVGRNNTGKSALLEAIALVSTAKFSWCDSLGDGLIEPIVQRRGGEQYADMMIKIGEQHAELQAKAEANIETVQIVKDLDSLAEQTRSEMISTLGDQLEKARRNYLQTISTLSGDRGISSTRLEQIAREVDEILASFWEESALYIGYHDQHEETEFAVLLGKTYSDRVQRLAARPEESFFFRIPFPVERILRSSPKQKSQTIFLLTPSIEYLKELQRRLAKGGELLSVIERMREKIRYFQDIREVKDDFLVFLKGLDRSVPLAAMGDGFRAKLAISSALSTVKKGIALMEEPETRLHPGYMSTVANEIAAAADYGNLQFFLSTHSLEFIELMLEEKVELVKIVRLYRQEDSAEIDYELLEGQEAKEDLQQLKLDLRGV
ncbi:AAA family ATPase [Candidatus Bathyarchaeota archaeon]|nr:AAA family ATPase [Candidatus Bathyarchaeota archaeon]